MKAAHPSKRARLTEEGPLCSWRANYYILSRENEGTERDAQGVGWDMSCPRKLFLDERKSGFRDVRRQHCLALRFLVKRENGDIRGRLINIYIHHVFSKGN